MAGYSKTPLPKKLGIKADALVAVINAPADFQTNLGELPVDVEIVDDGRHAGACDVILFFTRNRADLSRRFRSLAKALKTAGGLWIAWPKKASGIATDLTEDRIREIGLDAGLVDNKVCAIDEIWSGLRFVIRLSDRPNTNTGRERDHRKPRS